MDSASRFPQFPDLPASRRLRNRNSPPPPPKTSFAGFVRFWVVMFVIPGEMFAILVSFPAIYVKRTFVGKRAPPTSTSSNTKSIASFSKLCGSNRVKVDRADNADLTANAPQIFADSPFSSKTQHEGAGNCRKPQIFAENCRKPQIVVS